MEDNTLRAWNAICRADGVDWDQLLEAVSPMSPIETIKTVEAQTNVHVMNFIKEEEEQGGG